MKWIAVWTLQEKISKLQDRATETIQNETQSKKIFKWTNHQWAVEQLQAPSYIYNWSSEEEREGKKNILEEIMHKAFPNWTKTVNKHTDPRISTSPKHKKYK